MRRRYARRARGGLTVRPEGRSRSGAGSALIRPRPNLAARLDAAAKDSTFGGRKPSENRRSLGRAESGTIDEEIQALRHASLRAVLGLAAAGAARWAAARLRPLRRRAAADARRRRLEHIEQTLELTALVDEAVEYAASLVGVDAAVVEIWQGRAQEDALLVSSGLSRAELDRYRPLLESLREAEGGPAAVELEPAPELAAEDALVGAVIAAFASDNGIGGRVAVFWRRGGVQPDERSTAELNALVRALRRAAQRREHLPALMRAPTRDRLTGLHNRRFFESDLAREVERSRRHKRRFVLLVVDIDDFGLINERLGRHEADAVLAEVAGRLVTSVRTSDSAARLGRDEFAFILVDTGAEAAERVFSRFRGLLERSIGLTSVQVSASAGASEFAGDASEALLERARAALEEAKARGIGQIVVAADGEPA
jgi:diguanylate cyclase (GGDEF)-like protein